MARLTVEPMEEGELLRLARAMQDAGEAVVLHIARCQVCIMAEALDGKGYCFACTELWNCELKAEEAVRERLHCFRDLGIDVDDLLDGFKFWASIPPFG
jgi:hypothetical protein